ncbi:MAG TPA: hypothetical protein VN455_03175 [Methanotrichaceae archaeon]|nr:hypothetical protein [Methanotrichaceae archaeon]
MPGCDIPFTNDLNGYNKLLELSPWSTWAHQESIEAFSRRRDALSGWQGDAARACNRAVLIDSRTSSNTAISEGGR